MTLDGSMVIEPIALPPLTWHRTARVCGRAEVGDEWVWTVLEEVWECRAAGLVLAQVAVDRPERDGRWWRSRTWWPIDDGGSRAERPDSPIEQIVAFRPAWRDAEPSPLHRRDALRQAMARVSERLARLAWLGVDPMNLPPGYGGRWRRSA